MSFIKSLTSTLQPREDKKVFQCALGELSDEGKEVIGRTRAFQYFPETITDNRSVDYIQKNAVGASHPLYQWVYSGPRTISFQATFTSEQKPEDPAETNLLTTIENVGAAISNLAKNPVAAAISAIKGKEKDPYTVNVSAAVAWLRSKTYPLYLSHQMVQPPPKLILFLPNSGITSGVGMSNSGVFEDEFGGRTGSYEINVQDSITCIMTGCDVTYEAFFRNGYPRIATVDLQFAEIIQVGRSWAYIGRDKIESVWLNVGPDGYNKEFSTRPPLKQNEGNKNPINTLGAKVQDAINNIAKKFV